MKGFGNFYIAVLFGTVAVVSSVAESDKPANQQCPVVDELSREKLAETIRQLMESLQSQGISEQDLLTRVERDAEGNVEETCGAGSLRRCPREFKPVEGHVCENVEPIEPRGPFCNCPYCTGKEEKRKEVREVDFEENEAMKAESAKMRLATSVYQEKWLPNKINQQVDDDSRFKVDFSEDKGIDELPRRNLFSCQRSEPVYDVDKFPISGDPDFEEQLKSMTEEEQQPSLGILKFHEKRSRDEAEL